MSRRKDEGFMMVALLVAMSIAAIWMAAALTNYRVQAQRQKEDDLIFRGEQYARAIALFQNQNRGANPPDIDTLLSQHFLRKKWKDPMTGKDFDIVGPGIVSRGTGQFGAPIQNTGPINTGGTQQPGITGVRSTSGATSLKIYNSQQQYSLWQFDAATYRQIHGMPSVAQLNNLQNPQNPQNGGRQGPPGAPGTTFQPGGPGVNRGGGAPPGGPGRVGGAAPPVGAPVGGGRGRGY
jgi:type II secretory pathway pseudopilin PulG